MSVRTFLARVFPVCVFAAAMTAAAAGQVSTRGQAPAGPAPDRNTSTTKDFHYDVVVTGCINGKRLERPSFQSPVDRLPFEALHASAFVLDGPKELLRQLLGGHDDHEDRIRGVAIVPPSMNRAPAAVATRKIGPISIGIGGRQETSEIQRVPQQIKLKVVSLEHLQSECAPR